MLLSILIGTGVYILAQFFWYSPWAFGPQWSRHQKTAPVSSDEPLALPGFMTPNMRRIVLPALIVSFALHVFRTMTIGFGLSGFFFGTVILWLGVVARKYLKKEIAVGEREKWLIEDGALLWSLSLVAVSVVVVGNF
jgi:hypothetical protein